MHARQGKHTDKSARQGSSMGQWASAHPIERTPNVCAVTHIHTHHISPKHNQPLSPPPAPCSPSDQTHTHPRAHCRQWCRLLCTQPVYHAGPTCTQHHTRRGEAGTRVETRQGIMSGQAWREVQGAGRTTASSLMRLRLLDAWVCIWQEKARQHQLRLSPQQFQPAPLCAHLQVGPLWVNHPEHCLHCHG